MNQLTTTGSSISPFDSIKRYREDGGEYWSARELMPLLGYTKWQRFGTIKDELGRTSVVNKARMSCNNSGSMPDKHFIHLPSRANGLGTIPEDWHLTRYGCYLIAQNGDIRKLEIAAAQSYFAIKTHQAEIVDAQLKQLPVRDSVDYIQAAETLTKLPDNRLTRLLNQMLVSELSLISVNQKQLSPVEEQPKQYTTATVRASQLGYTAKQIGNGASLGKFVKQQIEPDFLDWQGQYQVNHYEVCEKFDQAIHNYFN